jgi:glycosyltransferase involved in cell wall biosynthesis
VAQERKKRRIVLASVLKPVDDTRMFEKMGLSLAQTGHYEVTIIGFPSAQTVSAEGIRWIPLTRFKRLSVSRIVAKWRIMLAVFSIKPDILIFGTHELIPPSVLLKIFMDVKIVYDVRENYYRNILYSGSFPWMIRWPLALAVRFKEKLLAPAVDHFMLAEKGYEKEFKFHRSGWTVIENKSTIAYRERKKEAGKIRLLFSGTLAESTGIFQAIRFANGLHDLDAGVELHIVGYAAVISDRENIHSEVQQHSWISVTGIDHLVPHHQVVAAIQNSDAAILSYPNSLHTSGSHPTKLFEYLSACLPIILENGWSWIEEYQIDAPFIFTEFQNPDYAGILQSLKSETFYPKGVPARVTWTEEAQKFLGVLERI